MYIGYFDEFGHNGPYISRNHKSHKTHPVFGLGGFIIPVDNVRALSGSFRKIKEQGLKEEIQAKVTAQGKRVEHWEKKGSALLTTANVSKYREVRTIINRVLNRLSALDAKVVFYGQEKPRGDASEIQETNAERYDHAMKQLIRRIHCDLPDDENLMLILDKQGDKERLEVFAGAASFMFSNDDASRLLEPPLEVESHLYQTVQCADWICALLGRVSAYKFDPDFEDFKWAPKYFGDRLAKISTPNSKVREVSGGKALHPAYLGKFATCYDKTQVPASRNSLEKLRNAYTSR